MKGARVLIVDDDPAILRALRRTLEAHSYLVRTVEEGRDVPSVVAGFRPDVILLDLMLPDTDGVEVCRSVRPLTDAWIIVVSAVGDDLRKVEALDHGADDYVTKPFSMDELLARIRVSLRRRSGNVDEPVLRAGPVEIHLDSHEVFADGRAVHLTPTEFELLHLLARQQGRVLTQRLILQRVWGPEYADESHILRTFIHQLRRKLSDAVPEAGKLIVTDPGVGYRIAADNS
ncbi:MAG: response regulator transcription factor [Dehalococcoidia bacterium]